MLVDSIGKNDASKTKRDFWEKRMEFQIIIKKFNVVWLLIASKTIIRDQFILQFLKERIDR